MCLPPTRDSRHRIGRADAHALDVLHSFLAALRQPMDEIVALTRHPQAPISVAQRQRRDAQLAEAAQLMTTLQAQFVELLQMERNSLPPHVETVDAVELMHFAAEVLSDDAAAANVTLEVGSRSKPVLVRADRSALKRVLLNLVSNAIRYNIGDGQVELWCNTSAEHAHLSVTDTGIGLSAEELNGLFTPFQRFGKELSCLEGTGMGLAVSHRLMAWMDGWIEVTSDKTQGTTFRLVLPLAQSGNG